MDFLNSILDEDSLEEIIETFDENLLKKLDSDNIKMIINYLKSNNIDFIEDILVEYTDIFSIEINEFIRKFEKLKNIYGANFCYNLAFKMDILERMWEL